METASPVDDIKVGDEKHTAKSFKHERKHFENPKWMLMFFPLEYQHIALRFVNNAQYSSKLHDMYKQNGRLCMNISIAKTILDACAKIECTSSSVKDGLKTKDVSDILQEDMLKPLEGIKTSSVSAICYMVPESSEEKPTPGEEYFRQLLQIMADKAVNYLEYDICEYRTTSGQGELNYFKRMKSLGSDGLYGEFYKKFWDDVSEMMSG
ncbi:uncharacterized protein LOC117326850 isoform X2 [Pecten maximus]|uniref:uncharacterized protein LOC117326850 isoform X2 n=1 Tax=Pecten maximus TaxID=6579 RepID=UPI001458C8A1|nr:uncharacterized protein LOC117326850 isoform X2 [Pecten maximus]